MLQNSRSWRQRLQLIFSETVPIEDGCRTKDKDKWHHKFSCRHADGQVTWHTCSFNPLKLDLIVKCFENEQRDLKTAIHIMYAKGQNRYRYMFRAC